MADAEQVKTKVVMVQSPDGVTRTVKVNGVEIPAIHCGPVVGAGQMNFVLTVPNVDIEYEKPGDAGA